MVAEQEATPQLITARIRAPVQPISTETQNLSSQSKPVKAPVQPIESAKGPVKPFKAGPQHLSNSQNRNTASVHCVQPIRIRTQHLFQNLWSERRTTDPSATNQGRIPATTGASNQDARQYWMCRRFGKYISYTVYVICFSPFKISEGRLESNPECSRSKRARYWFSQHSPCYVFLHEA